MLCLQQPPSHAPFARHVVYSPRGYIVPRRDGRLLAGSTSERAGFDAAVTAGGGPPIPSPALLIAPPGPAPPPPGSLAGPSPPAAAALRAPRAAGAAREIIFSTPHHR